VKIALNTLALTYVQDTATFYTTATPLRLQSTMSCMIVYYYKLFITKYDLFRAFKTKAR